MANEDGAGCCFCWSCFCTFPRPNRFLRNIEIVFSLRRFRGFSVSPPLYVRRMQSALRDVELDDLRDVKIVLGSLLERLDPDAVPTCDADAMWNFCIQITRMGHAAATRDASRTRAVGN